MAVVTVNPSASLFHLCPEEDEEGVREVGVEEIESSKSACCRLCGDEVSDQWVRWGQSTSI